MRRHPDDFWQDIEKLPATVDGRKWQAHPMEDVARMYGVPPEATDNPEDFYDYIAEWRAEQRRNRIILQSAAILGLLVGLGILIFAVVR